MRGERRPRRGGFTLLELMIVVGISSITVLTAVAVFAAMLNQKRTAERTMEVYTSLAMAQGVMEYDVANAGWRFPAPAVAVRVRNAVGTATSVSINGLGTGSTMSVASNCANRTTYGLVEGSDVLELAEGYADESNGVVQSATSSTFILKGTGAPLAIVAATDQPVVLFTNPAGDIILGKAAGAATAGTSVSFTLLNPDFSTATASPYASSTPSTGMNVYRLGRRTRYLLCRDLATGSTRRPMMYRQQSGDDGTLSSTFELIQEGVADLQIGLRVSDPGTGNLTGGSDCAPAGSGQFCFCNVTGPCGGTDQAGSPGNLGPFFQGGLLTRTNRGSADQWLRGVVLGLTGVSTRRIALDSAAASALYLRPALLDHAAATGAGDGNLYLTQQRSVGLRNLTQVIP